MAWATISNLNLTDLTSLFLLFVHIWLMSHNYVYFWDMIFVLFPERFIIFNNCFDMRSICLYPSFNLLPYICKLFWLLGKKPDLINLLQCFDFEKIKTDFSNLFSLFSIVSNKQKIQFLEQIIDCHIHLVSGAGIWTHYLSLYCESPTLTTNHCVSMTLLLL